MATRRRGMAGGWLWCTGVVLALLLGAGCQGDTSLNPSQAVSVPAPQAGWAKPQNRSLVLQNLGHAALSLGAGIDPSDTRAVRDIPLVLSKEPLPPVGGPPRVEFRASLVNSFSQYYSALHLNLTAELESMMFGGGVSTNLDRTRGFSSRAIDLVIAADCDYGTTRLPALQMTAGAQALAKRNPQQFVQRYGTHVVIMERRFASAQAILHISASDENKTEQLRSALFAEFSGLAWNGKLSTAFQSSHQELLKNLRISVAFNAVGGAGAEGLEPFTKGITGGDDYSTTVDAISNAFNLYLKGMKNDVAVPQEFYCMPLSALVGLKTSVFDPDALAVERQKAAEGLCTLVVSQRKLAMAVGAGPRHFLGEECKAMIDFLRASYDYPRASFDEKKSQREQQNFKKRYPQFASLDPLQEWQSWLNHGKFKFLPDNLLGKTASVAITLKQFSDMSYGDVFSGGGYHGGPSTIAVSEISVKGFSTSSGLGGKSLSIDDNPSYHRCEVGPDRAVTSYSGGGFSFKVSDAGEYDKLVVELVCRLYDKGNVGYNSVFDPVRLTLIRQDDGSWLLNGQELVRELPFEGALKVHWPAEGHDGRSEPVAPNAMAAIKGSLKGIVAVSYQPAP